MRTTILALAITILAGTICTDSSAEGLKIVRPGGGDDKIRGPRPMKNIAITDNGGQTSNTPKKKEDDFKKWDLPAAVTASALDTSKFDAVAESLKLEDVQVKKIDDAKAQIGAEVEKLNKWQDQARDAYQKAEGKDACTVAYQRVAMAGRDCKQFDPERKFEQNLLAILKPAQWSQYKVLSARNKMK